VEAVVMQLDLKTSDSTPQVREIRVAPGKVRDVGASYGVSGVLVSGIKRRVFWKELPDA
jgi:hypothetical protein